MTPRQNHVVSSRSVHGTKLWRGVRGRGRTTFIVIMYGPRVVPVNATNTTVAVDVCIAAGEMRGTHVEALYRSAIYMLFDASANASPLLCGK